VDHGSDDTLDDIASPPIGAPREAIVYVVSCLPLGVAPPLMAIDAAGGPFRAYFAIRRRIVRQYRQWMLQRYILIFGDVTCVTDSSPNG
jgi:hypothetical protein